MSFTVKETPIKFKLENSLLVNHLLKLSFESQAYCIAFEKVRSGNVSNNEVDGKDNIVNDISKFANDFAVIIKWGVFKLQNDIISLSKMFDDSKL